MTSHVAVVATPLSSTLEMDASWLLDCWTLQWGMCVYGSPRHGLPVPFVKEVVAPGRYFIAVRTLNSEGPFELAVQVTPWATNDTCATAETLTFAGDVATAQGDTRYSASGLCSCSQMRCQREVAYRFSTVGLGERSVEIWVDSPESGTYTPQAALETRCGFQSSDYVLACEATPLSGVRAAYLERPLLPEGEYFIQVGGENGGPFTLTTKLGPASPLPANDNCAAPGVLDLSTSTSATAAGDTRGAETTRRVPARGVPQGKT